MNKWQIVEVHFSASTKKFRVVRYDDNTIIKEEHTFNTRVDAEMFLAHKILDTQEEFDF
jgi:hypothetical protein|tara:strand:+ start:189 stop:365 length:177 start_codon:yes stop_codon:yes gene_type:complete